MPATTFTVVMPTHNTAETIGPAVRSVLAQTRPDFELIVIDDGSSDETVAVVESIDGGGRIRILRREHTGAAAARNTGVMEARGRYVSFLDSDDLWMPGYLEAMGSTLDASPACGFAYTDAWTLDSKTARIGRSTAMALQRPPDQPPFDPNSLLVELLDRNFVYTATTVRREVFSRVGLFDESLRAAIDYEMWLRIAASGYTAARPPGLLAVYRVARPGSISSSRVTVNASLVTVYERLAANETLSSQARRIARKRASQAKAELEALEGASSLDAVWRVRLRPALVHLRHRLLGHDPWLPVAPPEVAAAFPDLDERSAQAS
jgi:glycosyltransferase involved in cell wall biosynthesis